MSQIIMQNYKILFFNQMIIDCFFRTTNILCKGPSELIENLKLQKKNLLYLEHPKRLTIQDSKHYGVTNSIKK